MYQGMSNKNKIVPIFLYHRIYDLYTQLNDNPNLQPNWPSHFGQQSLPSMPYLENQVGQAGQRLLAKLAWPIWLQIWIFIQLGIEIMYPVIQKNRSWFDRAQYQVTVHNGQKSVGRLSMNLSKIKSERRVDSKPSIFLLASHVHCNFY